MSHLLISLFAGFTITVLVLGVWAFVNRHELEARRNARAILERGLRSQDEASSSLLRDERVSQVEWINTHLSRARWISNLSDSLHQGNLNIRPSQFVLIDLLCLVVGALIGTFWGWIAQLGFAAALAYLPWWYLRRRKQKRLSKFELQLPEAIDMLVSAMRAGYSFQMAAKFLSEEMSDPLGTEFARFYDEQRLGVETREALRNLEERTPSLDLKMFVTAVLIVRENGGNLSEVLGNLADMMRARIALRGQIETLIAEPKMSAKFLSCLPAIVFLGLLLINPEFMLPFVHSSIGKYLLLGAAGSAGIGYLVMMKIAAVDF